MTEGAYTVDRELIEATNEILALDLQDDSINEAPLPDRVFHYTDAPGLIGIIEGRCVWATDFRFLNDQSELRYTFELARRIVREEYSDPRSSQIEQAFIVAAAGDIPERYASTTYYMACFTELENSLSQWRAYAGSQGYCLEFPGDIGRIAKIGAAGGQNPGLTLLRVEYDISVQRRYVMGLIDRLIDRVCSAPHLQNASPETALRTFMPFYWAQLERASYRFKHPDFAVEQEWRFVAWGEVHDEKYRSGRFGVTPYMEFVPVSSVSFDSPLPVRSVRHGPTENPSATAYALRKLLDRSGYSSCITLGSDTPVRL